MSVLRPELHDMLVERAEADAARFAASPSRRRGRLAAWFASHSMLALIGGVVAVGGAGATAAAVVSTIHGTPSAATHGTVPAVPAHAGGRVAPGSRTTYRLRTFPSLEVGRPGWCDAFGTGSRLRFGSFGCGPAPTAQSHVFIGSAGGSRRSFQWHLVDRTVAYMETEDGARFLPRADPTLPNGWQVIVLLPGQTRNDHARFRDAQGRPVSPRMKAVGGMPIAQSTGSVPAGNACGITAPRAAGYDARGSHWVSALRPTANLNGSAFLACAATAYRIDDAWAEVTVLIDAGSAGAAKAVALPGAYPQAEASDVYELPAVGVFYFPTGPLTNVPRHGPVNAGFQASARRVGRAWIVVRAKSRALRSRVLRDVTVTAPGG